MGSFACVELMSCVGCCTSLLLALGRFPGGLLGAGSFSLLILCVEMFASGSS